MSQFVDTLFVNEITFGSMRTAVKAIRTTNALFVGIYSLINETKIILKNGFLLTFHIIKELEFNIFSIIYTWFIGTTAITTTSFFTTGLIRITGLILVGTQFSRFDWNSSQLIDVFVTSALFVVTFGAIRATMKTIRTTNSIR